MYASSAQEAKDWIKILRWKLVSDELWKWMCVWWRLLGMEVRCVRVGDGGGCGGGVCEGGGGWRWVGRWG